MEAGMVCCRRNSTGDEVEANQRAAVPNHGTTFYPLPLLSLIVCATLNLSRALSRQSYDGFQ
jgi:hypothetical protein